jgi:hypothetical protein
MHSCFAHKSPTPAPDDEPIPGDEEEPDDEPPPHPDPVAAGAFPSFSPQNFFAMRCVKAG